LKITQIDCVIEIFNDGQPHTLFDVVNYAESRRGGLVSQTGISSAIRKARKIFKQNGQDIVSAPGKTKGTWIYQKILTN